MSRQELIRIMSRDDKAISEVSNRGTLPTLYRKILFELGVDSATLLNQLERFINDPVSRVGDSTKKKTQARGNYIKKIVEREKMTWKTFMDLIGMLYPEHMRVTVELYWSKRDKDGNPITTTHSIVIPQTGILTDMKGGDVTDSLGIFGGATVVAFSPEYEYDEDYDGSEALDLDLDFDEDEPEQLNLFDD